MLPANFNQLFYFWTVAKTGSISAASRRLLLNQSTVSLQMKHLEASLGITLLSRGRPGANLTEPGRLAFDYCDRIFAHSEEMLALLRSGSSRVAPQFRLGISQSVPREKILAVTGILKALAPQISVRILSRSSEELESRLERRMLDLVVSDLDLSVRMGRAWRSRLAWNTPLYFVAAPRFKTGSSQFPRVLASVPLLLRAPENPVRKAVDNYLAARGIVPDIRAEVEDPELIRTMTLRGEGAAIIDPASVKSELARGRLVKLHSRPVEIRENVWLICAQQPSARKPIQAALDALMARPVDSG